MDWINQWLDQSIVSAEHGHRDPFGAFFQAMEGRIIDGVSARLLRDMPRGSTPSADEVPALQTFYTAKELARRWHFSKVDTIYEIPEFELPRRRVGAGRGKTLFYWLDVLVYEQTLTRNEADALQERLLEVPVQVPLKVAWLARIG